MKNHQPRTLIVDCGREYTSREFLAKCATQGVTIVVKSPSSPFQKGREERAFLNARVSAPKA